MEDKQKICDLLLPALQATSDYKNLMSLEYTIGGDKREYVTAAFKDEATNGIRHKTMRVFTYSGVVMILDIVRELYWK